MFLETYWLRIMVMDFPGGSDGKASAYNAGDPGSFPGLGRSPGEGNGNPLQYFCLENPMDGGACRLQSMGSQSRTQLSKFTLLQWLYILWDIIKCLYSLFWFYVGQMIVLCIENYKTLCQTFSIFSHLLINTFIFCHIHTPCLLLYTYIFLCHQTFFI